MLTRFWWLKTWHQVRFYITFLFLIFMPILQVFFSFFSSFNDIQILSMTWSCNMYKNKLTLCYQKNRPLCFDVIAKCYKRHRFLPSATLWALSILPQLHLCLPFTRIIHRYSESENSERTWRRRGGGENDNNKKKKGDPTVAKLSTTGCMLETKKKEVWVETPNVHT